MKKFLDLENENNCINLIAIYISRGSERERKGIWYKKTDATLRYVHMRERETRESSSSHAEFKHSSNDILEIKMSAYQLSNAAATVHHVLIWVYVIHIQSLFLPSAPPHLDSLFSISLSLTRSLVFLQIDTKFKF